jgi:tRNA pseudouridine55 synthase
MATGLLIVGTGRGTKACDTFMAMSKSYSGTMRLGEGTVTYAAEADVSERLPWEGITDEDLKRTAASFTGEQMQV